MIAPHGEPAPPPTQASPWRDDVTRYVVCWVGEIPRRWRRGLEAGKGRSEAGLCSEYDESLFARGVFAAQ